MNKVLNPVTDTSASEGSRTALEAAEKKFGRVPNLMRVFANNPSALNSYLDLSEHFGRSGLSPIEQQVVLLTISRENGCEYCMAAHSAGSVMAKIDEKLIQQLRNGESLMDKKLDILRTFTKRMVSARGWLDDSDISVFKAAGYSAEHVLAVIVAVSMKTLSNYVNHIAEPELDEPFKPYAWSR